MKYGAIPTSLVERLALASGRVPIPLLDSVGGVLKARALMAGVRLGIFEAMREGSHDPSSLAQRLGLDADCLELLLRALVVADYVDQDGDRYRLSRLARRTVVRGGEMEMVGLVQWNYTQWKMMESLDDLLRTGRGVDYHETLEVPEAWGHYQRGMLELARLDAPVIARRVPVPKGARLLLDVAGSHGLLGAALCRRHPPMRSTVLDLPRAIEHARGLARAEGIEDLVDYRAGEMMASDWGSGHDVVLLCNILHHFRPERIRALLDRARAALRGDGVVAVWDIERPRRGSRVTDGDAAALFFRLTSTAGVYHADEYTAWLEEGGFREVRVRRPWTAPGKVLVTALA
jgi:hypothetical protein